MVTYNCLGMDYNEEVELPYQLLKEYCESIASTYIKMVKSSSSKRVRVWMEKGFRASASHVQALGEAVTATIGDLESPQHHCTAAQLSKWLQSNILLKQLAELVYVNLYGINKRGGDESPTPMPPAAPSLLPIPDGLDAMPDYPAFIDLSHIVWINSHLPQKYQRKWRFLFSSHIHGESFSTMAGRIIEQGPSVLIIEDSSGHIFGGFAACAWTFGPNFTGTDESFLFTAAPKMRVYPATNYNDHYQYINHHTKTLPNGLVSEALTFVHHQLTMHPQ
ncbi:TLD domain-containing protein KIAA1609-like [Papilio xuthus]|uniref:MTOR-associated protein MEAK7 n=1 Tax=Papilio xuthus TaxID=66420 RepID=A0A0N1I9L6_PAPXU|nr:TLD domain-containing protein KIAA1609-like [Papilio xuthus]